MAQVGSADLLIVPKFNNFTSQVNNALNGASSTASAAGSKLGTATGGGFGKGLTASGAIIGAFSSITSKAMSSISEHVGSAISRFDTLNNYPTVMQNLGYSADEASQSLSTMDSHLQGLPTALNDMASTVQGIVAVTGDLDQATQASLALNDMLLASGSSTQLTSAAMEQFRQILAKGKPDMQDWKSLTSAMPGQMNQLAEAMLGTGATANDLYAALGGGGAEATITTSQLLDAMIALDQEGSGSMSSFADQAKTATGGVATSMANLGTAVTRNIAKVMDAVGKDTFGDVTGNITKGINAIGDAAAGLASTVVPVVKSIATTFSGLAPAGIASAAAFALLNSNGQKAAKGLAGMVTSLTSTWRAGMQVNSGLGSLTQTQARLVTGIEMGRAGMSKLGSAFKSLLTPANLASAALVGITAAVTVGVTLWEDYKTKTENAAKATSGLADAVDRAGNLSGFSATLSDVGTVAGTTAMTVDELNASIAASVDKMNETTAEAETQIATLNTAQQIINECAGQTDLSAEAQGRLTWALQEVNDQLGLNLTATDVMKGSYQDANGEVVNLKDSVNELIEAKKEEARVSAITENLTAAYTNKTEAYQTYTKAVQDLKQAQDAYNESLGKSPEEHEAAAQALLRAQEAVDGAKASYDGAKDAVSEFEEELGYAAAASDAAATALRDCFEGLGDEAAEALMMTGSSVDELAVKLNEAGVSTQTLSDLGSANFAALAEACGYDTDLMVASIQAFNGQSLDGKSCTVSSSGNVIDGTATVAIDGTTYSIQKLPNGSVTVTANGNAPDGSAQRKVADLDSQISNLRSKQVEVKASGNAVDGSASSGVWGLVSAIGSLASKTITVKTIKSIITQNAAGGIRPHADGGIRAHADGAIATRAMPLDIVGEDGAEAIVPLTNKKYSQPFAKTIAEQMRALGGSGDVTNVYIDGSLFEVDGRIADAFAQFMGVLRREKQME